MLFAMEPAPLPALPIQGREEVFPLHRIFCVGRNFADHAVEMGAEVDREAPFYFTKSAHHVALAQGQVPYAPSTEDYHHEVELVVALSEGGIHIARDQAREMIFAYSLGLDMTRRDLQVRAKDKRRPWDLAKDVEASALVAPLRPVSKYGHQDRGILSLKVNGKDRQTGNLANMVWSVPEIIADLSTFYTLRAGDLIFMGTPAGVDAVKVGDRLKGLLSEKTLFNLRIA